MKQRIVILNGSPNVSGCTDRALREVMGTLKENGIETELLHVGRERVPHCNGCGQCNKTGYCMIKDMVNETATALEHADGLIVGCPVYFGSVSEDMIAFMDRLSCCKAFSEPGKIGAAVMSSWGGRNPGSFDSIYRYFDDNGFVTPEERYDKRVRGRRPESVERDQEGLQAMRSLGNEIASLLSDQRYCS